MPDNSQLQIPIDFHHLDLVELQSLQDRFAAEHNAACIIIDLDGNCVTRPSNFSEVCQLVGQTQQGREACDRSNLERTARASETDGPIYHMCQCCGFLDGSVPIVIDGRRVGYWLVGQCNALGVDRDDIALHARVIGADVAAVLSAYDKTTPVSVGQFEQILESVVFLIDRLNSDISKPV